MTCRAPASVVSDRPELKFCTVPAATNTTAATKAIGSRIR
jgi:hypothetical protein